LCDNKEQDAAAEASRIKRGKYFDIGYDVVNSMSESPKIPT